ncbi:Alpha/Beta hydrolase protein [Aspergillus caelatus]|uniref:Alpha/Beta hydrolase protein n=1 Tax=Aspergillus caelatus TaxID=61420 RepID=A0A5N6ZTB4_9EURO|nr:Alpha/Beta hydrolase protein [Aspergillus caelatus]KAE8359500.1 Alpha/Beta hydrolase protein [Aspergillus caelatus]
MHTPRAMASRQARNYIRCIYTPARTRTSRVPLAYELHTPRHANRTQSDLTNQNPIIFLHGFLGSKRENRGVGKSLAQDLSRQVFCLDLRNHGDSGHHPKHDYMEMAIDVEHFIRTHGLNNATLIGHSMGAKTALTLALQSPDLISKVVAIDNCPIHLGLTEEFPRYLRAMEEVQDARVKSHQEGDKILSKHEESPSVRLWLLSNFVRERDSPHLKLRVPLDVLTTAIGPLGDFPHKGKPVQFPKPALFLRALQSHYIPESSFPVISSFFPRSRIVNIDCGHWIVQERPEEFRQAVVQFLQEKDEVD